MNSPDLTDSKSNSPLSIRIYGLVPYDRSAKARWLLTEMGIAFETRWLNREKKEHEAPEFLRLNPMGRVPVLEIGGQAMCESSAICTHLADLFPDKGLAPLPTAPERPAYLQWMAFATATLDLFQAKIMIIEDIPAGDIQTTKLAALQSDVRDAAHALDLALSKYAFLLSDRLSAADICVGYHLYWLKLWPELDGILADFPRLTSYLERLKKMPAAIKADVFSYTG